MKRKICVVTGTRAEYGLWYWTLKSLQHHPDFELQLIVTGSHLSPEFGHTYRFIEEDGFSISKKIEILLSSDSGVGMAKAVGLGTISFAEAYAELQPHLICLLGDRFEILAAASAAVMLQIPLAHVHGGEITEGAIDDAIRHAVTKMSHLHFASTQEYCDRIIQMGEAPERVFHVGAPGLEHFKKLQLLNREELSQKLNVKWGDRNYLITFHPVTLDEISSEKQLKMLLDSLQQVKHAHLFFTKANADQEGRVLNKIIEDFVTQDSQHRWIFSSLGQLNYLSMMAQVDAVIGNSSSGLLEAPSLKVPTLNIGNRQKGRIRASSVYDCAVDKQKILEGLEIIHSEKFQKKNVTGINPYGDGETSNKIIKTLEKYNNYQQLLHKIFHDNKQEGHS